MDVVVKIGVRVDEELGGDDDDLEEGEDQHGDVHPKDEFVLRPIIKVDRTYLTNEHQTGHETHRDQERLAKRDWLIDDIANAVAADIEYFLDVLKAHVIVPRKAARIAESLIRRTQK